MTTNLGSFVGPDNGLFTHILAEAKAWSAVELANPEFFLDQVSNTFHGRDLFAPVAAHLANGVELGILDQLWTDL